VATASLAAVVADEFLVAIDRDEWLTHAAPDLQGLDVGAFHSPN
jgi:hypothetical protein